MATRIPDQERILESKVARREAREAGGREALERRKAYTRETGLDVDEAAQETEEVTVEQRKPAPGSTSKHKAQGGEESDDEDAAAAAADAAPGEVPAGGAAKKVNVVKRLKGEEEASKLDQAMDHGYTLEPFNLRQERQEGYFDEHGTYVWRKGADAEGGEDGAPADPWLAEVGDEVFMPATKSAEQAQREEEEATPADPLLIRETLSKHMRPGERVAGALKRLGAGSKAAAPNQRNKRQEAVPGTRAERVAARKRARQEGGGGEEGAEAKRRRTGGGAAGGDPHSARQRQQAFEEMTDACDVLLRSGEVDVYQTSREALLEAVQRERRQREEEAQAMGVTGPAVYSAWVYKLPAPAQGGKEEAEGPQIHGPYSFPHLLAWRRQGYFGDDSEALLRCVSRAAEIDEARRQARAQGGAGGASKGPTAAEELMDDLEDDEEEEGEGGGDKQGSASLASVTAWQPPAEVDWDSIAELGRGAA